MYTAPHDDASTLKPLSGPVLLAYARYLGLDPETEPELLHIAREALTDLLPLGWERHLDTTHNMPFFYCNHGGFTSWQHPQLGSTVKVPSSPAAARAAPTAPEAPPACLAPSGPEQRAMDT